jgi:apolipoprotein N-acyltransferase
MRAASIATVLAVLASGAMWFASRGIHHVWPLAWLAPLPLLVVLPDASLGRAMLAAFAASAIGALDLVLTYRDAPPVQITFAVLLTAVPFTLAASAWWAIARRARPMVAIVTYPALVVSAEYLVSLFSPHGTFGSVAYSQTDVPAVIQVASLTGLWGISFIVSLVPAALATTWRRRREPGVVHPGLALAALPLGLTLLFGTAHLVAPSPSQQIRVGLAVSDTSVRYVGAADAAVALPVIHAYAARVATLADRGAQVIVLPEKFVGVTPAYADAARAILGTVALERHVTIVAGFNIVGAPERRNRAVVFGPTGRVALEYDKMHLIPGLEEGYRRGTRIGLIPGADVSVGVAICKDLDFTPLGRAYGRAGVGLLLVPAWDFVNDGWLHSRMAMLRGVENGYAVARTATNGFLTVSDARGRIVAERASSNAPEVLVTALVPVEPGGTFYSRTGDWCAWLCVGLVVACIGVAWKGASPPVRQEGL